ncbi:MAG: hypothetical protein IH944_00775 [Armatimonadetes bacterium]|nr:hypothetical protein [Armatimonadota bacterium]
MRRLHRILGKWVGVAGALLATAGSGQTQQDEQDDLYKWFDTLGYDVVLTGEFVRIDETTHNDWDPKPRVYSRYGFLIKSSAAGGEILEMDLSRSKWPRSRSYTDSSTYEVVPINIEQWARARLTALNTRYIDGFGYHSVYPRTFDAAVFVLSRALRARSKSELATRFFQHILTEDMHSWSWQSQTPEQWIKDVIAESALRTIVFSADDLSVTRHHLAERFAWFVDNFNDSEDIEFAKEAGATYAMMAAEDKEHAATPQITLEDLTQEERISELIFRLRDSYGWVMFSKGMPQFFNWNFDPDAVAVTPQEKLVEIGFDAVPQLIDSMDDQRFVRGNASMRIISATTARVRDVVKAVLWKIANRWFYVEYTMGGDGTYDAEAHARAERDLVKAWWADVQLKGERQVLIDGVKNGGRDAIAQAERLARAYPDVAVSAIEAGIANVIESADGDEGNLYSASRLVKVLGLIASDESFALARKYMITGANKEIRLAAAELVAVRDADSATQAMIAEWERVIADEDLDWGQSDLVDFLLETGRIDALELLAKARPLMSVDARIQFIDALGWIAPPYRTQTDEAPNLDPGFEALTEKVIVELLRDEERDIGTLSGYNLHGREVSLRDARVSEYAAVRLAIIWPEKYPYSDAPSQFAKRSQAIRFRNTWRESVGLPQLPLPQKPDVGTLAYDVVRPLIDRALNGKTSASRSAALNALRAKGLPALGAVLDQLDNGDSYAERRNEIYDLAKRLSCSVRSVSVTGGGEEGRSIASRIMALEGRTLTSTALVAAINHAIADQKKETLRFRIELSRDGDGTGIDISVTFYSSHWYRSDSLPSVSSTVIIGSTSIHGSYGSGTSNLITDEYGPSEFKAAVHEAFDSDPRSVFWILFISRIEDPGAETPPSRAYA